MTAQPQPSPGAGEGQELRQIARALRRAPQFWPLFLIAFGLSAFACSAFIYFRHPGYRSETVLLYMQGVSTTDSAEQPQNPRNAAMRLKELLFSRPRLTGIVTRYQLFPDVTAKFGSADAVEELKRHIEFKAPGGDTFTIGYLGQTAAEAQQVTAALAQIVIEGDAELRKTQAEHGRDFLAAERATKSNELKDAEQRLATFMGEHRRFALDTTPLAAGAAIRATTPGMATARALPGPLAATPSVPSHPAPGVAAPLPAAAAADDRGRAVAALAAAEANLADLERRYGPAHPDVRAAQGQVERSQARLAALGPSIETSSPGPAPPVAPTGSGEPRVARRAVLPVRAPPAAAAPAEKEDVVALETAWVKLTREVTVARQRVDQVEAALFKAEVLASSESAGRAVEISVIDPAFLPQRPLGPSTNAITALFLLTGGVLGLVLAVIAAALDDRVYDGSGIASITPVLAVVPRMTWGRRSNATS